MSTPNVSEAELIARAFSSDLWETIGPARMAQVIKRNRSNPPGICASHDFCDANMPMADAFQRITGREISAENENDCALWCRAWDIAKANNFFQS